MEQPIVTTPCGKILGYQRKDINDNYFYAFLAIPYAKPPLGNLRFKDPEPIEPWDGVKDATKEGNSCYHRDQYSKLIQGSEDCLNLHVFTKKLPRDDKSLKPVMVWIHGGLFLRGSNTTTLYGPEILLTEDIVFVSINYRLGVLGFLQMKDQSLNIPGNAGMKDQQLALKWIQDNIKYFDGDPNNVTIFGASSGAYSVHSHVLSPTSAGLFHKAIVQSGTALTWEAEYFTMKFATFINNNIKSEEEALELLKNLPVQELFKHQEDFLMAQGDPVIISPIPGEAFLPSRPIDLLRSGRWNKVPIIFGLTNNEGLLMIYDKSYGYDVKYRNNMDTLIDLGVASRLKLEKNDPKWIEAKNKVMHYYFTGPNPKGDSLFITDAIFAIDTILSINIHQKTSSEPIYLYRMSLEAELNLMKRLFNIPVPGVAHCDELGYLLTRSDFSFDLYKKEPNRTYIRRFVSLWTNFARTGDPTPEGSDLNVKWTPFGEDKTFLDIGEEIKLEKDFEPEKLQLWREIFQLSPDTDYI